MIVPSPVTWETDMDQDCDYCGEEMPAVSYLRAVGFTTEYERFPGQFPQILVKAHCGSCPTPDDIDQDAVLALTKALSAQVDRSVRA